MDLERKLRRDVRQCFLPEDGAEEIVEFVNLRGVEGWEGYGGCGYALRRVSQFCIVKVRRSLPDRDDCGLC
jgi:hypothetical protein